MESYKSDVQEIACDINTVFSKLSNPEVFKTQIDRHADELPQEARENLGKVTFEADAITIESPMGPIKLVLQEKIAPSKLLFTAAQSPVAFNLIITLTSINEACTQALAELQLDISMMLRAMVGGQLKQAAQQFGQMLAKLPYRDM